MTVHQVLASIHIYPVKGCRGTDLCEAAVEPWGLAGDRRWLVVDADGRFVSQREQAPLARVVIETAPAGGILVSSAGYPPLSVAAPGPGELLKVSVWSSTVLCGCWPGSAASARAWSSGRSSSPRPRAQLRVGDPVEITGYAS